MMSPHFTKTLATGLLALSLSGCGTLGGLTGEEKLAVLKGASEHIQTCTRIYNVNSGFPPTTSVAITCMPPQAPQGMTAEQIAAIAAEAARKAVEEFTAPK